MRNKMNNNNETKIKHEINFIKGYVSFLINK